MTQNGRSQLPISSQKVPAKRLGICLLLLAHCAGCAITPIPPGAYEVSWSFDPIEMIVLPQPIDPSLFHPVVHHFSSHFGADGDQNICVIWRDSDSEGKMDTYLSLTKPFKEGRSWRVGLLDTYHSQEWLLLKIKGGKVTGTYNSVGLYGAVIEVDEESGLETIGRAGLQTNLLTVSRLGDSDLEACVTAGQEVLEQRQFRD